ncbi:MAG: phospho-N-acetylmuramoyl-pentapeptide-transferase [Planctomycetes bacterium]|nr:phospho-N-acetylmuramoyl-pentapeptide-transferase [Planctomycetota bacterium]
MLYLLFEWLTEGQHYAYWYPLFRAAVAVLMAFAIVWALGPRVIRTLIRLKIGDRPEFDHAELNKLTQDKRNTPTMGGVLISGAIFLTVLLLADLSNFYVRMGLLCLVWLALLGGVDDWLKLTARTRSGTRDGLRLWEKLIFQVALGALLAVFVLRTGESNARQDRFVDLEAHYSPYYNVLSVPFYKGERIGRYHGVILAAPVFALIVVVVIAFTSNAVNLTDGMDGLASGCVVLTALAFMVLAAVVGNPQWAETLLLYHIRGAGELAVVCGAIAGACLGFLWYNAYPAQVFMGDTGALPLGGLIGYVAIVTRLELMLLIIGGVFVIEAGSVLIQIFYFKATGGKRFFRCAPLHHHFHLGGWSETQVVMRFWLVAAMFAAFGVATMWLR